MRGVRRSSRVWLTGLCSIRVRLYVCGYVCGYVCVCVYVSMYMRLR